MPTKQDGEPSPSGTSVALASPVPGLGRHWYGFHQGLPHVGVKSIILTVVDKFSKFVLFIYLAHPYTTESVTHAFITDIVRLHGFPISIFSDRDLVFALSFWHELFRAAGTCQFMSSAFHRSPTASPRQSTRSSLCAFIV